MAGTFNSLSGERVDFPSFNSPLRGMSSTQIHAQAPTSNGSSNNDARASLTRRFTTNALPTLPTLSSLGSPLSPIGQGRRQAGESTDLTSATFHKVQLLEKKRLEYEFLKEQRRRFQTEMELIDLQTRNQENEMLRLSGEVNRISLNGHQSVPKSEPTTPPEYRDNTGFPSAFSRPNRFSTSSMQALQSPPGFQSSSPSTTLANHPNRHSSHIPPSRIHSQSISHVPSKSVPSSRRNSDEEEEEEFEEYKIAPVSNRSHAMNRISMPVTGYDLRALNESPAFHDTTSFLFKDEDDNQMSKPQKAINASEGKSFFTQKDDFPVLLREQNGNGFPQLSAALDLAPLSQSPGPDQSGWTSFARHRQGQQSLPMNTLRAPYTSQAEDIDPLSSTTNGSGIETPTKSAFASNNNNRRSVEVKFSPFTETQRPGHVATPPSGRTGGMPRLQSSYSTNDIPTIKSTNGFSNSPGNITSPPKTHAEQHLHNHNASMGRIPAGAVNHRHSRDMSNTTTHVDDQSKSNFRPMQSALQASAAPFGPSIITTSSPAASPTTTLTANSPTMPPYSSPAYYGGYGMTMLNNGINNLQLGNAPPQQPQQQPQPQQQQQWPNHAATFPGAQYGPYSPAYQQFVSGRLTQDSQSRVMQQRRTQSGDENARYSGLTFDDVQGQILALSKDQHGCRFLQKKLEERDPKILQIIFNETHEHMVELMIDPFGNYLCQKLLEYANDEQRTALINNAAPSMVKIALNQHGTRALQKMIEFISTPEQVKTITHALQGKVVELIQDLNGNHVIQKCLNHLANEDAQFIYDAVGTFCVVVGTHRHGCCVLQRCIDHASPMQKAQLVAQVTACAFPLVQDPFGNYVVQYILDLNENDFTTPLCLGFRGNIPALSKQKFSSNVVEKCIRVADMDTKRVMIDEMLVPVELEKMLRDSFANYVVQTAMEHADADTRNRLIDTMSPYLPAIRNTPYGRRIMSKIQEYGGGRVLPTGSGQLTPQEMSSPLSVHPQASGFPQQRPSQSSAGFQSPPSSQSGPVNGFAYTSTIASPQPHRLSNPPLPAHLQAAVNGNYPSINGRMGQFY